MRMHNATLHTHCQCELILCPPHCHWAMRITGAATTTHFHWEWRRLSFTLFFMLHAEWGLSNHWYCYWWEWVMSAGASLLSSLRIEAESDRDKFISIAIAVTTTVIATSYIIMIIRSQFLSLSSPHPQPQFLIVSTWSWELVRGGGQQEVSVAEKCQAVSFLWCWVFISSILSMLLCAVSWCIIIVLYRWLKMTSWPQTQIYTLKLKQDCC